MPGEKTVLYQRDGRIARITLNRPEKRNALNPELIAALKDALARSGADDFSSTTSPS